MDLETHTKAVESFLIELGPYLGLEDGTVRPRDFIEAAARIREGYATIQGKLARWECWARPVLENMALENEGAIFRRWPISHEPLRSDARNALKYIDSPADGSVNHEV